MAPDPLGSVEKGDITRRDELLERLAARLPPAVNKGRLIRPPVLEEVGAHSGLLVLLEHGVDGVAELGCSSCRCSIY